MAGGGGAAAAAAAAQPMMSRSWRVGLTLGYWVASLVAALL
jgi:hypothetical protein